MTVNTNQTNGQSNVSAPKESNHVFFINKKEHIYPKLNLSSISQFFYYTCKEQALINIQLQWIQLIESWRLLPSIFINPRSFWYLADR